MRVERKTRRFVECPQSSSMRGLKAFWLSDFKPITGREYSLHLKHLLVSLRILKNVHLTFTS